MHLTKHQVHVGINRAIFILISALINIICVIFKHEKGVLDYTKMQPRTKMFCVSSSRYVCLICDCDISWYFSLFSKHSFFRHDKILLPAKKEQVVAGKHI